MAALNNICKIIRTTGPMSVAQYMKEVLTNPIHGYYVHKNMLGERGDFVTSSGISQIFGELVGIWCIAQWQALQCPKNLNIVEFGPGNGTMASDILRTFKRFPSLMNQCNLSLNFIEISESLSKIQMETLSTKNGSLNNEHRIGKGDYYGFLYHQSIPMYWYKSLDHLDLQSRNFDDQCTIFLAYEFFDALPIHKFVKTDQGWKEIHVDVDKERNELKFVLMPNSTIATETLIYENESRSHIEISPESNFLVNKIGRHLEKYSGACLIGDYGHFGEKEDTFRGFKSHVVTDVLKNVGEADLTADVDFQQLLHSVKLLNLDSAGPITQGQFLKNMGIDLRTKMLMSNCKNETEVENVLSGYKMLTNPEDMGEKYKFIAMRSSLPESSKIIGFE